MSKRASAAKSRPNKRTQIWDEPMNTPERDQHLHDWGWAPVAARCICDSCGCVCWLRFREEVGPVHYNCVVEGCDGEACHAPEPRMQDAESPPAQEPRSRMEDDAESPPAGQPEPLLQPTTPVAAMRKSSEPSTPLSAFEQRFLSFAEQRTFKCQHAGSIPIFSRAEVPGTGTETDLFPCDVYMSDGDADDEAADALELDGAASRADALELDEAADALELDGASTGLGDLDLDTLDESQVAMLMGELADAVSECPSPLNTVE
jgi:hypothetical protein